MWKHTLGSLCVALTVWACASGGSTSANLDVFRNPQNFLGQQVRLCGYIRDAFEDSNIWVTRRALDEDGLGLGFLSDRALQAPGPWHAQTRCVTGEIVYTGCAKENVCGWSNFPYALKVSIEANTREAQGALSHSRR
jgi:hypothetical protein